MKEDLQLKDVMKQGKMCTVEEIKAKNEWLTIDPWRYCQLKHFVDSLPQPIRPIEKLLPLEKLCVEKKGKGGISKTYRALNELEGVGDLRFVEKWEEELGIKIDRQEVGRIMKRVNATSVNYKLSEMNYKILTRMYIIPDRAHRITEGRSQLCWRGCGGIGTMAHIWWQCPVIMEFWGEIRQIINKILKTDIPLDPWVFLHHGRKVPTKAYLKSLCPHLLNAAKSLIPRYWQDKRRPTVREWLGKINEIYSLEYLKYSEGVEMKTFEEIWKDWVNFRYSLQAAELWGI